VGSGKGGAPAAAERLPSTPCRLSSCAAPYPLFSLRRERSPARAQPRRPPRRPRRRAPPSAAGRSSRSAPAPTARGVAPPRCSAATQRCPLRRPRPRPTTRSRSARTRSSERSRRRSSEWSWMRRSGWGRGRKPGGAGSGPPAPGLVALSLREPFERVGSISCCVFSRRPAPSTSTRRRKSYPRRRWRSARPPRPVSTSRAVEGSGMLATRKPQP